MVKLDISPILGTAGASQPFSLLLRARDLGETKLWVHDGITVWGHVVNTGSGLRLCGTVSTRATLECSRCLKVFEQPVEFVFEEELDPNVSGTAEEWVDITEPVRAALLFQEPMQPLCDPGCKGLCPECGTDLNRTDCGCARDRVDPRLASLNRLLQHEQ